MVFHNFISLLYYIRLKNSLKFAGISIGTLVAVVIFHGILIAYVKISQSFRYENNKKKNGIVRNTDDLLKASSKTGCVSEEDDDNAIKVFSTIERICQKPIWRLGIFQLDNSLLLPRS